MKKDFIVRRSITMVEGKPHVETYSEQELIRCKDCKHGGCRTNNLDGSIYRVVCKKHSTKINERWMDADWYCADGEKRDG